MKISKKLVALSFTIPLAYSTEMNEISNNPELGQASKNIRQGQELLELSTGILDSTCIVLNRLSELAIQSASDTVGAAERSILNQEYTALLNQIDFNTKMAVWGGVKIFSGGVGDINSFPENENSLMSNYGLSSIPNSLKNAAPFDITGLVFGVVTNVNVRLIKPSTYELNVDVGSQKFNAVTEPRNCASINFEGAIDRTNKFSILYADCVDGITNSRTFQQALYDYFLLGATAKAAKFVPKIGKAPASWTVEPGPATDPGLYALTYQKANAGSTGYFGLTNGNYFETLDVTSAAAMTQNVMFRNGFMVKLNNFDGTSDIGEQVLYDVSRGSGLCLSLQVGKNIDDRISVSFRPINTGALGLTGSDIKTNVYAHDALLRINRAESMMISYIAELGAVHQQLKYVYNNLQIINKIPKELIEIDGKNLTFESVR